jgi:ElaB/YqjD/DUF883 family membrane-anchored ribosome-binding protein
MNCVCIVQKGKCSLSLVPRQKTLIIRALFIWCFCGTPPAVDIGMTNETPESSFPQTRQDLANLKKTAIDATKDMGSTASVYARKAQSNLQDLASHAQEESGDHLDQVKGGLTDLGNQVRDFVAARPFASIGAALALGFLVGTFRRGRSRDD